VNSLAASSGEVEMRNRLVLLAVGLILGPAGCGKGSSIPAVDVTPQAETQTSDAMRDTVVGREVAADRFLDRSSDSDARLSGWTWRDPWPVPEGPWGTCPEGGGTVQTLAAKAAYYDWYTPRLLVATGVTEDGRVIDYGHVHSVDIEGEMPLEIVPDDQLPQVVNYQGFGNSGLYTSLYTASQAFRYGATGEPEAKENVRKTLNALYANLRITGTPGYIARGFKPPLPGFDLPENPGPDDHCVEEGEFKGFCWVSDTSRDEYIGVMFAIAAVAKLVDDEETLEICRDMASQVGHHLIDHGYKITDENGEPTQHGSCYPLAFDHWPGFHALMALAWTSVAARVSGDPEIEETYWDCLLQQSGEDLICIGEMFQGRFTDYLEGVGSLMGCETSYDNVNMSTLAMVLAVWMEEDPELREFYRDKLVFFTKGPDVDGYDIWAQGSPHFNMLFSAFQPEDPARQGRPTGELVEEAICTLKRFPADKALVGQSTEYLEEHCVNVKGHSWAADVTPVEDRPPRQFLWWSSPYERYSAPNNLHFVDGGQDYLLSYWTGRYFGFISAEM